MRLIIAGGGTGGHLFPAIAVAEEFTGRKTCNEVLFVGTRKGLESSVLPAAGWPVRYVASGGVKGMGPLRVMRGLVRTVYGAIQSIGIIRAFKPAVILGVGGYASVPVVLAGKVMGVRAAVHEQNVVPGLANRLLGRVADRIFLSHPESRRFFPPGKAEVTGNPVRKEIIGSAGGKRDKGGVFTVLVFGGSRGAKRINEAAAGAFCKMIQAGTPVRVIHQTGADDHDEIAMRYREADVDAEVQPFISDMASAYARADLVVCRAGATTLSELLAAGKPALLVPYPFAADDHQRMNAEAVVKAGAARMIPDGEMTPDRLAAEITELMKNRTLLAEMGEKAGRLSMRDAAARVCDRIVEMAA